MKPTNARSHSRINLQATTLEGLFNDTSKAWSKDLMAQDDTGKPMRCDLFRGSTTNKHCVAMCLAGAALQVCNGVRKSQLRLAHKLADRIRQGFAKEHATYNWFDDTSNDWYLIVEFNNHASTTFKDIKRVIKGL